MAGICCGVVAESETSTPVVPSSRTTRRRRMEMRQFKFVADVAVPRPENGRKRHKTEVSPPSSPRECENAVENCEVESQQSIEGNGESERDKGLDSKQTLNLCEAPTSVELEREVVVQECPKFGMTSVCGRRRDMEDAVAIHPSFCRRDRQIPTGFHFFGVYDGHGCSHVAMKCKARLHEIVKEELESGEELWKEMMERSFLRMDEEVHKRCNGVLSSNCRCELQTPHCDAVGSTAVVAIVTPDKIIVSNCGDSRAVLCRNGVAIPLSSDHKPDRPDELDRIQAAGGRVIYWDGARVLGVLAMSRAIGDNYLKPYVISEPEVTIMDRTAEDECLILASDGLWDVVSNETACGVARMCLRAQKKPPPSPPPEFPGSEVGVGDAAGESSDKACSDASILLTKLALARHSTDNVSVVVVDLRRCL